MVQFIFYVILSNSYTYIDFLFIIVIDQFGLYCMDYEVVRLLIDILQYNYPETLDKAFIINAPYLFSGKYYIFKTYLHII